ncbi:MAG: hypothetical protein KDB05_27850 [Planctomycetales bacterium]|nr:hypothetical protein [Planctomycetales bacterium]
MVISAHQRSFYSAGTFLLCLVLAQWSYAEQRVQLSDPATWREIEAEMFDEINRLRRDPAAYAVDTLEPLKATLKRIPKNPDEPYEASRIFLSKDPIDYIEIPEGESTEEALAVIDEAIAELKEASKLAELKRSEPLDQSARWFSTDFQQGGETREPHIDSLDRLPGARISTFGATTRALAQWDRFATRVNEEGRATIYVFKKEEDYFFVELPARGGYRYRSVDEAFGKFVAEHGIEVTVPRVDEAGFELEVAVDVETRTLRSGETSIRYPLQVPAHGENVVWGPWSRQLAARGLVCWWILDPGVPDRGHRHTLLEPTIRYCGLGCTWSRRKGFVATFDATVEELLPLDRQR